MFSIPKQLLLSNSMQWTAKHSVIQHGITVTAKLFCSQVCWKCGVARNDTLEIFCPSCNILQKPSDTRNYFKLFGLEEQFKIDQRSLRGKFIKMQSLLHPDKYSNKPNEEQTISEEYSALLNLAHSNLQSPLKRAEHLLTLKGEKIEESQIIDDPKFLMEMMILNEEVEEAERDANKLIILNEKNKVELERISEEINEYFKIKDMENAKKSIVKMKYFNSISLRINGKLRELGVTD